MKLLASDYDGTFKTNKKNLYFNIYAIEKFRENRNKFAIVTGRSYSSIKREIYKYNIDYDYLSCNNGLIIFDNKDNIIKKHNISLESLQNIFDVIYQNERVNKVGLYNLYDITYEFKNILEIFLSFETKMDAIKFKKEIEESFNDIKCSLLKNKLFIGKDINKADAVSFIQRLENIHYDDVYTIGDDLNDLEMLKQFHGYKMLNSSYRMLLKNLPITQEVHTLIKKIDKR